MSDFQLPDEMTRKQEKSSENFKDLIVAVSKLSNTITIFGLAISNYEYQKFLQRNYRDTGKLIEKQFSLFQMPPICYEICEYFKNYFDINGSLYYKFAEIFCL